MVNLDPNLDRTQNHLGYQTLGMSVRGKVMDGDAAWARGPRRNEKKKEALAVTCLLTGQCGQRPHTPAAAARAAVPCPLHQGLVPRTVS